MHLLTREQLRQKAAELAAGRMVEMPDFGGAVHVKALSPEQVLSLMADFNSNDKADNIAAMKQAIVYACDLFDNVEDLDSFGLSFGHIVELFDGVARLSGIDGKDVAKKAKN